MAGEIQGITIEIGGNTQPLQRAIREVSRETNGLEKELKFVDKALKLDPKNTDMIRQKQQLLAQSVVETKNKLETLKTAQTQAMQDMSNGIQVNQEEYRRLQREIAQTSATLENLEEQSTMANTTLGQISTGATNFGNKAVDMGNKLAPISALMAGVSVAGYKLNADLQDSMGATEQIFKSASNSMKEWADKIPTYYGVSKGEALDYANTMGAMLQNIGGLSQKEAAKQSQALVQLAGDLSAMFGGSTEQAVQALTGALKGNNSMLDNYGMGVNDATIKTKALEMGLSSGSKELTLQAKQAATLALIMEQTGNAQGQAGREAEGASGSLKQLSTVLKDLGATLGETIAPMITPVIQGITTILKGIQSLPPELQQLIGLIVMVLAVAAPILITVGKISIGIGAMTKAIALIAPAAGAATAGAGGFAAIMGAIASPIGIAILAIVGLGLALKVIIDHWDDIKKAASNGMKAIGNAVDNMQQKIDNTKAKMGEFARNTGQAIKDTVSDWKQGASEFGLSVKDKFVSSFQAMQDGAKQKVQSIYDFFKSIFDKIVGFFTKPLKFPDIERPKIPLPQIKISGKFSLDPPSVPHVTAGIKWYANGGIFNSASVIGVGEAGQEAVLPINKLDSIMAQALQKAGNTEVLYLLLEEIRALRQDTKEIPYKQKNLERLGGI